MKDILETKYKNWTTKAVFRSKITDFMFQLFKQKKILSAVVNRERYKKIYSDE